MKPLNFCLALSLAFWAMADSTQADLIVFTDRAAWRAAAGGNAGDLSEDLNTFTGFDSEGRARYGASNVLQIGFLNFGGPAGRYDGDGSWSISDNTWNPSIDGTNFAQLGSFAIASGAADTIISFSEIAAFGFDYAGPSRSGANEAEPLELWTSRGDTVVGPSILAGESGFFGFIYDDGATFTSVRVRDGDEGSLQTFFSADNFEAFSSVTAVPEPSSLLLVGLSSLGFTILRVRRDQETVRNEA